VRSIENLLPRGCRARLTMASTPDEAASHKPGWRNWQTQRTQNPSEAIPWGFDSPSRHHLEYQYPLWNQILAALVSALYFWRFRVGPALGYEFRYRAHPLSF
jgi:hypothetical protein